VKSKGASSLLSKLAFSNALVQNANEETINIPTKMFISLFNEAIETSTIPVDSLRILFCESKEPSNSIVIVDDVPQKVKNQNKKHPKLPKGSIGQRIIISTRSNKGVIQDPQPSPRSLSLYLF
jgi:hypothetical protein